MKHLRPLTFGEILDGGFVLYRRALAPMFALAVIPQLPVLAYWAYVVFTTGTGGMGEIAHFAQLYTRLANAFAWAALVHWCSAAFAGEHATRAESYQRAGECFWRLVGVSFLVAFASFAGALFLIVPGVVLYCILSLATQAVVLEDTGVFDGLRRAWGLGRPLWKRVTGVLLVAVAIFCVPLVVAGGAVGLVVGEEGGEAIYTLVEILTIAIAAPFLVATKTLLYYDCRVRTEALDVEVATERLPVHA